MTKVFTDLCANCQVANQQCVTDFGSVELLTYLL